MPSHSPYRLASLLILSAGLVSAPACTHAQNSGDSVPTTAAVERAAEAAQSATPSAQSSCLIYSASETTRLAPSYRLAVEMTGRWIEKSATKIRTGALDSSALLRLRARIATSAIRVPEVQSHPAVVFTRSFYVSDGVREADWSYGVDPSTQELWSFARELVANTPESAITEVATLPSLPFCSQLLYREQETQMVKWPWQIYELTIDDQGQFQESTAKGTRVGSLNTLALAELNTILASTGVFEDGEPNCSAKKMVSLSIESKINPIISHLGHRCTDTLHPLQAAVRRLISAALADEGAPEGGG